MSMFRGPWWIVRETVASLLFGAKVALKWKCVDLLTKTTRTMRKTACRLGLHATLDSEPMFTIYDFHRPSFKCRHCGERYES